MTESDEFQIMAVDVVMNVVKHVIHRTSVLPGQGFSEAAFPLNCTNRSVLVSRSVQHITSYSLIRLSRDDKSSRRILEAVYQMQRAIRGFMGRGKYRRRKDQVDTECDAIVRNYYAVQIQRHIRGFLSRRHVANFRKLKQFLKELHKVNAATRISLRQREAENFRIRYIEMTVEERIRAAVMMRQQRHLAPTFSKTGITLRTVPGRKRL